MDFLSYRILHLDVHSGDFWFEELPRDIFHTWIGGKGLAGYYLRPYITRSWHDPDMPFIFMAGPLVATPSPTSGRVCVMSRSPLTGTVGDCSVGGSLGFELRRAGLMGIVITGAGEHMCGIEIKNEKVDIIDARQYSGKKIGYVTSQFQGKGAVAAIGPAAESGVLFANIMVDGSFTAGRNGLGSVLAAKNIKYITVKGTGKVYVQNRDALKKAREDIFRLAAASPVLMGEHGITNYGTGALYDLLHTRRMMPTANFRKTRFESAPELNANVFKNRYSPKRTGCKGCHILCKKVAAHETHIPEFETMSHFCALLENEDLETITEANSICNEMGMDTISAGGTLACYSELTGEKLSPPRILGLLEQIGNGIGIGKELATGSFRYASAQGRPECSMSVKKLELPAYDPRGAYGMALAYVTSTRGGCHLRAYPISHEILRKPVATDRFSFEGKARIIKIAEDTNAIIDSLIACKFIFFGSSLEEYAKVYTAVTGYETTAQDLLKIGERIYYHERIMNALNGFTSENDDLPSRFFSEEGSSGGGITIAPLNRKEFLQARKNYCKVRGLDEHGIPCKDTAEKLGLDYAGPNSHR